MYSWQPLKNVFFEMHSHGKEWYADFEMRLRDLRMSLKELRTFETAGQLCDRQQAVCMILTGQSSRDILQGAVNGSRKGA